MLTGRFASSDLKWEAVRRRLGCLASVAQGALHGGPTPPPDFWDFSFCFFSPASDQPRGAGASEAGGGPTRLLTANGDPWPPRMGEPLAQITDASGPILRQDRPGATQLRSKDAAGEKSATSGRTGFAGWRISGRGRYLAEDCRCSRRRSIYFEVLTAG